MAQKNTIPFWRAAIRTPIVEERRVDALDQFSFNRDPDPR